MHKWLAPSSIHFLQMDRQLFVDTDDTLVIELSQKLAADEWSAKVPKMQVSERDGHWFALNNSSLQLMLQLQKQGKLLDGLIEVEVVPLTKVPTNIQRAMIANTDTNADTSALNGQHSTAYTPHSIPDTDTHSIAQSSSRRLGKKKGYHKLAVDSIKGTATPKHKVSDGMTTTEVNTSSIIPTHTTSDDEEDSEHDLDDEDEDELDDESTSNESSSGEEEETVQCNVCDRSFARAPQLAAHQLSKKHFGCSVCETVFPSLTALEQHKETLEHWSDTDNHSDSDHDNDAHNSSTSAYPRPQREELERLL
ncbi:unnamed protein product [Oppiella nova]|uniref:C2H2-type domain-containing protein n=1 Tax=Oppiella nova TaxID=334625 RepID=A0A7R9LLE7_9ACAR|nr:unnamed protein product [Oppiella nova]CAG2164810.1 unnamed protein product [Oppiella nova]